MRRIDTGNASYLLGFILVVASSIHFFGFWPTAGSLGILFILNGLALSYTEGKTKGAKGGS